ncbi:HipA domain-containing protein [Mucilaginibacter sp. McL0603]|uniref:HipA domain-containing protein n=1 Tax=Mucilaginibacter sp. McL0603 TaxID=3415670 RepID=UPI003CF91BDE
MSKKCLYCYRPLNGKSSGDFHEHCSLDFFGTKIPPDFDYTLDQMTELAKNVVERSIAVPGVQPKLSLTLLRDALANGPRVRLTVVGAPGGNYIFKPPSTDFAEMPQNEHVTMRIAEFSFGLQTVPSSLIRLKSGELAYITRRIDRTAEGTKIHMLDMLQILEAFDKYRSSMERVGKAIAIYSSQTLLDQSYYFELAIFSFLSGNNDMHLKNFSMISKKNDWVLAPAYDLLNVTIVNPQDAEELALTLDGKKRKLKPEHFKELAKGLGLTDKQVSNTFKRFRLKKDAAFDWLESSFLSEELIASYKDLMNTRYQILGLE